MGAGIAWVDSAMKSITDMPDSIYYFSISYQLFNFALMKSYLL